MPWDQSDQKYYDSACGYAQLGMFHEANETLEQIAAANRAAPKVLALRVAIYQHFKKWDLMREISKRLHEFEPNNVQWLISYAFATRRALSIETAREILLKSVASFSKEAVIYFNLACYECQLGQMETSKEYLRKAFDIDASWRATALDEQDLEPLWDSF